MAQLCTMCSLQEGLYFMLTYATVSGKARFWCSHICLGGFHFLLIAKSNDMIGQNQMRKKHNAEGFMCL